MRRSRFARAGAFAGFIVLVSAGCAATGTTAPPSAAPTAAITSSPSAVPSLVPSPEPSAPIATPTAVPTTPAPTTANGWQNVLAQPSLAGVQLNGVTWTGTQFLADGILANNDPGLLASTDGQTWTVVPSPSKTYVIQGLGVSPSGLVAVGGGISRVMTGGVARAWVSKDGSTWVAAPISAALRPSAGTSVVMNAITWTGSGWLAVGAETTPCNIDCNSSSAIRAVVWKSPDGLTWTRQPDSASLAHAQMNAIVRNGSGYVAVGAAPNRATTTSPEHAVAWTSPDGRTWSRGPDSVLFHAPAGTTQTFGVGMLSLATDGSRLVAVGTVGSQDVGGSAVAWWSSDGRTWHRGTGAAFLNGQLFNVAAVAGGFLATGPNGPDNCRGGIFSSTDGGVWTCIATDAGFGDYVAYAAAASPQVEVVVGFSSLGSGPQPVWTRSVP